MANSAPIHFVFMLEEESAKFLLEGLLPKILSSGTLLPNVSFQYIPHQGKSDLQKSIPRKLAAWKKPNSFFVILHDLDANPDCIALKNELRLLCMNANQHEPLIRIICQELEAWYFGDLDAVQKAFPEFNAAQYKRKPRYRHPDEIHNPSKALNKIVKNFTKGLAARTVPQYMDIENNTSVSFNHTITGIRDFVETQMNAQINK